MSGTLPAVSMRGGTSKVLMLHRADVPGDIAARPDGAGALRVGMPSGVHAADAAVTAEDSTWRAERGSFFRTARPLMRGAVFHDATPPR